MNLVRYLSMPHYAYFRNHCTSGRCAYFRLSHVRTAFASLRRKRAYFRILPPRVYGSLSVRVSPVSAAAFSWACWAGAVFLYSFKAQTLTSQADHKVVTQSRTQAHDSRQQLFHHLPQ